MGLCFCIDHILRSLVNDTSNKNVEHLLTLNKQIAFNLIEWFLVNKFKLKKKIRSLISLLLFKFSAPIFEVQGLIFSRIHVVNSTGPAPAPIGGLPSGPDSSVKNYKK